MSILETPRLPEARVNPTLMMGAASPLWSYFAAAAASGVAYWWMTRWSRPANLEAFFAAAGPPAVPATPVEVVEIVAEVVAEEPRARRRRHGRRVGGFGRAQKKEGVLGGGGGARERRRACN